MRYVLIFSLIIVLIISCNNSYEHVIKYENLQTDLTFFQDKKNKLNEIQNEFLRYLSTYGQNPEIKTSVDLLNDNRYTFSRAFSELAKFNNEVIKLKDDKDKLFKAIDDICRSIQQKVDMQKHLRDSINSLVKPDINIARKTKWDYYLTAIEIDSRILNFSNSTVKYVSFDYILKKNDTVFFKIPCEVELPIEKKLQRDFIFDDKEHTQIYKNLKSFGLPFYSADYQVKKIVFENGNTLAINEEYYSDKQYTSPSKLAGECPYLKESDLLLSRFRQLQAQVDAVINEASPTMNSFLKWYFNY